ncbi:MAG: HIT family protein [Flavobacteriaceae bacterium]
MPSIFTKIINGEIPCFKIAEDENCFAFLDVKPNSKGHTLCVLKKEVDKIFDLSEEDYLELMKFSRRVAFAIKKVVPCNRIGLSVIGLEIPHVHVHLIPLNKISDAKFINKAEFTNDQFEKLAFEINKNFV